MSIKIKVWHDLGSKLGNPGRKMNKTVHSPRFMNGCRILQRIMWAFQNFIELSRYFTCDEYLIVSLTKNLLWNIQHIVALTFSFGIQLNTSLFLWFGSNASQYYSLIIFVFQMFTHANLWCELMQTSRRTTGSNCVDRMLTFGKTVYWTYIHWIQITPVH